MSDEVNLDPLAIATELTTTAVRLVRWLQAVDPAPELTPQQASAMAAIVHSGGISPSDLADLERSHRPTISRLLAGLTEKGLVRRFAEESDGRATRVVATAAGRCLWQEGQRRRTAPLAKQLGQLSANELAAVETALAILEKVVQTGIAEATA